MVPGPKNSKKYAKFVPLGLFFRVFCLVEVRSTHGALSAPATLPGAGTTGTFTKLTQHIGIPIKRGQKSTIFEPTSLALVKRDQK